MATSPYGGFADLSSYQALVNAQKAQQLAQGGALNQFLGSIASGAQQGNALVNLQDIIAQQNQLRNNAAIRDQINTAVLQRGFEDPNFSLNQAIQREAALKSLDPTSGITVAPVGLEGQIITTPQDITPEQQAAIMVGGVAPSSLQLPVPGAPITPILGVGGTPTGFNRDISIPQAAQQAEQQQALDLINARAAAQQGIVAGRPVLPKISVEKVGNTLITMTDGVETGRIEVPQETQVVNTKNGVFVGVPGGEFSVVPGTESSTETAGPDSATYNKQQLSSVNSLMDRYKRDDYVKKAEAAQSSLDIIQQGLSQNNSAGDIAAINQFQSGLIDPGATVREGDVQLIVGASPLLARAQNYLPRLIKGGVLPPEMRNEIKKLSIDIYNMRANNANDITNKKFKKLAVKAKINFEDLGEDFDKVNPDGSIVPKKVESPVSTLGINLNAPAPIKLKSGNTFQLAQ